MNALHIHVASGQPATRYSVDINGIAVWLDNPRSRPIRAACCGFRRQARNLVVQAYYDEHRFTCVAGKGCKTP